MFRSIVKLISFTLLISMELGVIAWAEEKLAPPKGKIILEVAGNIGQTNKDGKAQFDAKMLDRLPQHTIRTKTLWTEGVGEFSGPKFLDLLEHIEAKGKKLSLIALNDYRIEIPFSDLRNYPVILATRLNGKHLRVRDKGPLWVIYPWADYPELRTETIYGRSVWQLRKVVIE